MSGHNILLFLPFFADNLERMKRIFGIVTLVLMFNLTSFTQASDQLLTSDGNGFNAWHMLDNSVDGIPGVGADRAYKELLAGKKSTPVVVAIIDSGTESFHPDLKANIWTNKGEIADNGIDEDENGYVDDIHGWSFIGGIGGDVSIDNLEFTRVYRELKNRFGAVVDAKNVKTEDKKDYERYLHLKKEYDRRIKEADENLMNYVMIEMFYSNAKQSIATMLGKEDYTLEEVMAIEAKDEFTTAAQGLVALGMQEDLMAEISQGKEHFEALAKFQLNLDFDPRYMVGDNYNNVDERYYGNNHIDGPESEHGTHVGGIVGAVRNEFGMNGVADNVQLMIIRAVPNGDERDKDIANAIRYAVDNGARIINMSFGKSYSPQKAAVDAAVKYAESKGVLIIHAAGNDAKNIDKEYNFPTDKYIDGGYCSTWMEIGASNMSVDNLVADFSNYGKKSVDVFAPGVDIYSTVNDDKYKDNSGTSMAAPVTSGVAATLMSYFPNLTASDVKEILMKSAIRYPKAVTTTYVERNKMGKFFMKIFIGKKKNEENSPPPREFKSKDIKFKDFSVTGGVVNLYEAVKMAEGWKK